MSKTIFYKQRKRGEINERGREKLYGNEDCKYIDVAQEDLRVFIKLIEKLQKENEELKNDYENLSNSVVVKNHYIKNSIPIQKVKDNIEKEIKYHEKNILDIENVNMLRSKTAKEEAEIEFNKYAIVVLKKMLQELIEESEGK